MAELLCTLPTAPPVAAAPRGASGATGHNSTGTVVVQGARYRLRQSGAGGPAAAGKSSTDAAKLGRAGVGFLFLDTAFLPVDVYLDAVGTAETLYFVAGGLKIDEALLAQILFGLLGQPSLVAAVEGDRWGGRAAAVARLTRATGDLTAALGALPPPDTGAVDKWPHLRTHKPVKRFDQMAGLGALLDAALNTGAGTKLSAQRLCWADAGATRAVSLHHKLAEAVSGVDRPPLTVFQAGGAVATAPLAETTFNFEARLRTFFPPADPPAIAQGLFANFTSLLGDVMPGPQAAEVHGRFVRRAQVSALVGQIQARVVALIDELERALEPTRFNDTLYLRFPFHHKRLYLEGVKPQAPSDAVRREGWV